MNRHTYKTLSLTYTIPPLSERQIWQIFSGDLEKGGWSVMGDGGEKYLQILLRQALETPLPPPLLQILFMQYLLTLYPSLLLHQQYIHVS